MPPEKRSPAPVSTSAGGCHFGAAERDEALWLIRRALLEDLPAGDVTTDVLFQTGGPGEGRIELHGSFTARAPGVVCGVPVVENLFGLEASGEVALTALIPEGHPVKAGEAFLELRGPPGPVLRLERTALGRAV